MLKVLFQNRPDALSTWGGDTTQMMQTKEFLQKLGVTVEVSLEAEPELSGYDIVHVFNIQTASHGLRQLEHARRSDVPVVLSPIYWSNRHFYRNQDFVTYHSSAAVRLMAGISWQFPALLLRLNRVFGFKAEQKHRLMLEAADLLLPNSFAESEILAIEFGAPWIRAKSLVVPNGITVSESQATGSVDAVPIPMLQGLGEYVLEVGRIEPVKGQLKLIQAMMAEPDIPLVFVGKPEYETYFDRCRELGEQRGNTYFIPAVPHGKIEAFYRQAKVHALPSLRESPGLVTLEAALYGTNCVVSIHGPIMEYFGTDAWSCDPEDVASIRDAVLHAWRAPRSEALSKRILRQFTWNEAARLTLEGYRRVLAGRG